MNKYFKYMMVVATLAAVTPFLTLPVWAEGYDKPVTTTKQQTASGIIQKIDPAGQSLTIKGVMLTKTFQVANNAMIVAGGAATDKTATLSDLKVGDKVDVTYEEHGGVLTAHRIAQLGETAKPQGKEEKTPAQPSTGEQPPSGEQPTP